MRDVFVRPDVCIQREFGFLENLYGFDVFSKHYGPEYSVIWTNPDKHISIEYDCLTEAVTIRVYAADSFGFDAEVYRNEFALGGGTEREKIHCAAQWLKAVMADKTIPV